MLAAVLLIFVEHGLGRSAGCLYHMHATFPRKFLEMKTLQESCPDFGQLTHIHDTSCRLVTQAKLCSCPGSFRVLLLMVTGFLSRLRVTACHLPLLD